MTALTDRIAAAICEHREYFEFDRDSDYPACSCGWEWDGTPFSRHLAAVVAAVVYPRIDTVEQLDALPRYCVVKDIGGEYWEKLICSRWDNLSTDGSDGLKLGDFVPLPAVLIWQPEAASDG